jgi:hypothetical protein
VYKSQATSAAWDLYRLVEPLCPQQSAPTYNKRLGESSSSSPLSSTEGCGRLVRERSGRGQRSGFDSPRRCGASGWDRRTSSGRRPHPAHLNGSSTRSNGCGCRTLIGGKPDTTFLLRNSRGNGWPVASSRSPSCRSASSRSIGGPARPVSCSPRCPSVLLISYKGIPRACFLRKAGESLYQAGVPPHWIEL